jgi:perosamine synthetase
MKKIPVYQPTLGSTARANVLRCLDTNWISSKGEFIDQFEAFFARRTGAAYSASVCNGTVALHLALLALDIRPGDEIIVPTFTYIASVNAIAYVGATPVFADSVSDSWQLDPVDILKRITPRTRAIIPVHLYGQPVDMHEIMRIARENNLLVIEDCAEAFGSYIGSQHVGSWGDVATYSFFGNKTITTGEGGAVTTNSPELNSKIRKLRGQGLAGGREYWHDVVGYNYRMTNICAGIGLGQLEMAGEFIARKREIATTMRQGLEGLALDFMWEKSGTTSSFWMNTVRLNDAELREPFRSYLAENGIETRPAFYPAHTMPMYQQYDLGPYPVAECLSKGGLNLPSAPSLTDDDVSYILETIRRFYC